MTNSLNVLKELFEIMWQSLVIPLSFHLFHFMTILFIIILGFCCIGWFLDTVVLIDLSVSTALKCKQANQNVSFASSDRGLTATRLCSVKTHADFSDFQHFQTGSVDFELIMVKCWVWGNFKSDAHYFASFEGDLRSLSFQNQHWKM